MSRSHLSGIVLLFLAISLFAGLYTFPQVEAVAILDENFDSETPPALPTGWTDASGGTATCETDTDFSQSSPNAVRSETNTIGVAVSDAECRLDFGVQTDIDVSFQWLVDSGDSGNACEGVEPECALHSIGLEQSAGDSQSIAGMGLLAGGNLIRYRDWLPSASTPSWWRWTAKAAEPAASSG